MNDKDYPNLWHLAQGNLSWITAGVPELQTEAEEVLAEIERLKAIVDKLPKTADGVPVVPGMRVWRHDWQTALGETVSEIDGTNRVRLVGIGYMYHGQDISSTHAAAEAAGEAQ